MFQGICSRLSFDVLCICTFSLLTEILEHRFKQNYYVSSENLSEKEVVEIPDSCVAGMFEKRGVTFSRCIEENNFDQNGFFSFCEN